VNIYTIAMPDDYREVRREPNSDANLLKTVPPNVVQSIRAFRIMDLQVEAARLGQHFLYAYCGHAATKLQVLASTRMLFIFQNISPEISIRFLIA
jgi:hypothetical protein